MNDAYMDVIERRLLSRVEMAEDDGCWVWTAGTSHGYGIMSVGGRPILAHRLAWEFEHGEIPTGASVRHSCDNKLCIRPSHLYLFDRAEIVSKEPARDAGSILDPI